jgi:nucleotide-binding universal stress UspA family protein
MFEQIVVGVDGGEGGRDAIALARSLLARDGELMVAHIYAGDPRVYRSGRAAYEPSKRERTLELLDSARAETGVQARLAWRGSSSVGRGLHELCEVVGADLLVVGASRRGLLGRVLVGDDTRASLNGARCAVAIAPTGFMNETVAMRDIGVGYDGSPESEHALQVARELAAEVNAKVSAFQAASFSSTSVDAASLPLSDAVDAIVEEARNRIEALGGVEPHAAYGRPAEELAVYSASLDLLVVGSRGYGPIGRLIHGSTSQQLARTARCPLLVLSRAVRATETPKAGRDDRGTAPAVKGLPR